jgi:hypothetical protein
MPPNPPRSKKALRRMLTPTLNRNFRLITPRGSLSSKSELGGYRRVLSHEISQPSSWENMFRNPAFKDTLGLKPRAARILRMLAQL